MYELIQASGSSYYIDCRAPAGENIAGLAQYNIDRGLAAPDFQDNLPVWRKI